MLRLYSAHICPYAHRTRIVLEEKSVAYRLIEVDLKNKAEDFLGVSRYGKVPCIIDEDGAEICESWVINEYLEETRPEPPLLPKDPVGRARARVWMDWANTRLFKAMEILRYKDANKGRDLLFSHLGDLNADLAAEARPFVAGESFTLADAHIVPMVTRLEDQKFDMAATYPALWRWYEPVKERPSIQKTR